MDSKFENTEATTTTATATKEFSSILQTHLGKTYICEDRFLSLDEVKSLTTGSKVWCNLKTNKTVWCIGTMYKHGDETFIITNLFSGQPPGGWHCKEGEWNKYGKYSWGIVYDQDLGTGVKLAQEVPENS